MSNHIVVQGRVEGRGKSFRGMPIGRSFVDGYSRTMPNISAITKTGWRPVDKSVTVGIYAEVLRNRRPSVTAEDFMRASSSSGGEGKDVTREVVETTIDGSATRERTNVLTLPLGDVGQRPAQSKRESSAEGLRSLAYLWSPEGRTQQRLLTSLAGEISIFGLINRAILMGQKQYGFRNTPAIKDLVGKIETALISDTATADIYGAHLLILQRAKLRALTGHPGTDLLFDYVNFLKALKVLDAQRGPKSTDLVETMFDKTKRMVTDHFVKIVDWLRSDSSQTKMDKRSLLIKMDKRSLLIRLLRSAESESLEITDYIRYKVAEMRQIEGDSEGAITELKKIVIDPYDRTNNPGDWFDLPPIVRDAIEALEIIVPPSRKPQLYAELEKSTNYRVEAEITFRRNDLYRSVRRLYHYVTYLLKFRVKAMNQMERKERPVEETPPFSALVDQLIREVEENPGTPDSNEIRRALAATIKYLKPGEWTRAVEAIFGRNPKD